MILGKSICYKGLGVFPGIAIGKAFPLKRFSFDRRFITDPEREIERLDLAFLKAVSQLESAKGKMKNSEASDHLPIIDAYLMMLKDPRLKKDIGSCIRDRMVNAEWAVDMVIDKYKKHFEKADDPYLSEKARDLDHIKQELLNALLNEEDIKELEEGFIVVAHDLSPADTVHLNLKKLKGFALEGGGRASHTAILARSLEIPAVIQAHGVMESVEHEVPIIIDGIKGIVIVDPDDETLSSYESEKERLSIIEKELLKNAKEPAETLDGFRVNLYANLEFLEEIQSALRHGSEGVGLFRTEYLYIKSVDLPSVSQQVEVYRHLAEEFKDSPVVIRTLDLGGEKGIPSIPIRGEANPALGLRAIRLCLKMKNIFIDQLEAILRASVYGDLRILFPLVTRYEDVEEALEILERVKSRLSAQGVDYKKDIKVGAMLEVPSSVFIIDKLSDFLDFFSVGSNDLIQYTLAVDRGNDAVSQYFDPLHPAVVRLLKEIADACQTYDKPVSICGEMGGNPVVVPLLLGLGYNQLSMNPLYIPVVKEVIRTQRLDEAKELPSLVMSSRRSIEAWGIIWNHFRETTKEIYHLISPFISQTFRVK